MNDHSQVVLFTYLAFCTKKNDITLFYEKHSSNMVFCIRFANKRKKTKRREQKSQLFTLFPETNTVFAWLTAPGGKTEKPKKEKVKKANCKVENIWMMVYITTHCSSQISSTI